MELALTLNPGSKISLQDQIFDQVRTLILQGRLHAGMMLPSSRALANEFRISRNTATIAYERLAAEGYVESRGRAGVFVTSIPPDDLILIGSTRAPSTNGPIVYTSGDPLLCFAGSPGFANDRPLLDFWVGRSAASTFPLQAWRRIVARLLTNVTDYLTDYCDPAGLPELRKAIADHLALSRGMDVTMDQIVITAGGQDALNLVVNLLRGHTRHLCIENPCYVGASMLFRNEPHKITPIPVDQHGLKTALLPDVDNSLVYVTPSHQFPTGVLMNLTRRINLLKWAEQTDSYIIEDDYDSDFRYDSPPVTSLAGLDGCRRVLYVGTFSKSIGAGLRLGFAVVPRGSWESARTLKARMSNGQSWLEQRALAEFLSDGHFDRHVRKLRQIYKSRRDCLMSVMDRLFGAPMISGQESGLHLVWHLFDTQPSARSLQAMAREHNIGVYALSSGAAFDFDSAATDNKLMLGYSSLTESEITTAMETIKNIIA